MDWVRRLSRNGSTVAPNGRTYRITTNQLDQWVIVRETPVAHGWAKRETINGDGHGFISLGAARSWVILDGSKAAA